jgi:restriction endonuclease Mrr
MDIFVHNRNVGGALGGSPIVLAEAKNWVDPVGPNEYASFLRKLLSRHGRAKLGYLVTTGRFTSGVADERRRDSMADTLVVLIDGDELPKLWRDGDGITGGLEATTMLAAVGS